VERNVVTLFPLIGTGSSGEGRVRSPEARYAAKQIANFYSVHNGEVSNLVDVALIA
jgi:hypothetical protein